MDLIVVVINLKVDEEAQGTPSMHGIRRITKWKAFQNVGQEQHEVCAV